MEDAVPAARGGSVLDKSGSGRDGAKRTRVVMCFRDRIIGSVIDWI